MVAKQPPSVIEVAPKLRFLLGNTEKPLYVRLKCRRKSYPLYCEHSHGYLLPDNLIYGYIIYDYDYWLRSQCIIFKRDVKLCSVRQCVCSHFLQYNRPEPLDSLFVLPGILKVDLLD